MRFIHLVRWLLVAAFALPCAAVRAETPPADARDPHEYAESYDFARLPRPHAHQHSFGMLRFDRFERAIRSGPDATLYDLHGWYGGSYDRAVIKAEGEYARGKLHEARTELLWSHAIAPFWDSQLGVRHDDGTGPGRTWLAFGIAGLAPYWFDVEATAYLGTAGRTALRLAAGYELLLTQRLILQPRVEANFHGRRDDALDRGTGLSDAVAGLRLRYEINRQFAPYFGVERSGKIGNSAGLVRAAGGKTLETRWVAGVRFWF